MKIESMSLEELQIECRALNLSTKKIVICKKIKRKTKKDLMECLKSRNIEFDKTLNIDLIKQICEENNCETTFILEIEEEREKTMIELIETLNAHLINEIVDAKVNGNGYQFIKNKIIGISNTYAEVLKEKITNRTEEMNSDDNSHYLIYNILGISNDDGKKIDLYQNTGRFLYKYAGAFLEEITVLCFKYHDLDSKKAFVDNSIGQKPKTFEIDCLSGINAYEIKWRDATTDGDHITKEHTRIKAIKSHGYTPIRIMFYYPNREQAQKIQDALKAIYTSADIQGRYYSGEDAWTYIKDTTQIDLKKILTEIIEERNSRNE